MSDSYEVEIKSLLGDKDAAEQLRRKLHAVDPTTRLIGKNTQLNHYFTGGDVRKLRVVADPHVPEEGRRVLLKRVAEDGKNHSVRTREHEGKRILVVKSSIDDTTSDNGIMRLEFESPMPHPSLDALDELVRSADFDYQAKWSREREEYEFRGIHVCLDRNAGYGYLAEFEKVVATHEEALAARAELIALMKELRVEELSQERLARMFAFYNANWRDYYGTDKVFTIY